MKLLTAALISVFVLAHQFGCLRQRLPSRAASRDDAAQKSGDTDLPRTSNLKSFDGRVIHVIVALCDNVHQGIVPVSEALGNGDDPKRNLYWGAAFGVKTYFSKSRDWKLVATIVDPKFAVIERLVFEHTRERAVMVADAYRGAEIKRATGDLLLAASGANREAVETQFRGSPVAVEIGGGADFIAYAGHDGLMDFRLENYPEKRDDDARDVAILACKSRKFFDAPLRRTGARPLLWTTNLMAPEAYVLDAAIKGWLANEDGEKIRERAAAVYHKYQNCGIGAARGLFTSGW